jgi:hypothetical protein
MEAKLIHILISDTYSDKSWQLARSSWQGAVGKEQLAR